MRATGVIAMSCCVVLIAMMSATHFIASTFNHQPALGAPLATIGQTKLYVPWSIFSWTERWAATYPKPFAIARLIVLAGFILAFLVAALALQRRLQLKPFGKDAWAKFADLESAGLFAGAGAVLGKFDGEIIAYDGPDHQLLIGASRSGKGRGHVVPTLLTWNGSALVLDVKGELDRGDPRHGFPGTSGFRARLGPVRRFAPTDPNSDCYNPLFEVRRGANEIRDVQNLVDIIVDKRGEARGAEAFWNDTAKIILTGVIVDTLYAEPLERKTFAVVREKLRDLDKTAEAMRLTLHRKNPKSGEAEVHPEVLHAAESYLAGEERLRSGVKATAESFFGLFADPLIAEKTSHSDFRLSDLMCGPSPMTLYLQPPPSDGPRLMPLLKMMIDQTARRLLEDQTHDADGKPKNHRLLLMLDEFPQLGRFSFFEKMMGAMAGYGLKAYLVCQSLNHITKSYGHTNVILDNCGLITAFAASDPETAERIASMAGEVWEIRPTESEHRPRSILSPRKGSISYREERRPLLLPADVRGLPRDEQLIFASGCKPIRANKLRFDHERIFAERLLPAARYTVEAEAPAHDWVDVVALGRLPPEKKPASAGSAARRARPAPPPTSQSDLFGASAPAAAPSAPPQGKKISEIALAGFRQPDAEPSPPPPPTAPPVQSDAPPPRRARATGV